MIPASSDPIICMTWFTYFGKSDISQFLQVVVTLHLTQLPIRTEVMIIAKKQLKQPCLFLINFYFVFIDTGLSFICMLVISQFILISTATVNDLDLYLLTYFHVLKASAVKVIYYSPFINRV